MVKSIFRRKLKNQDLKNKRSTIEMFRDMQIVQYHGSFMSPIEFVEEKHVSMALCHNVVFDVIKKEMEEELCQVGKMKKNGLRLDTE